jgi:hypothetical protein
MRKHHRLSKTQSPKKLVLLQSHNMADGSAFTSCLTALGCQAAYLSIKSQAEGHATQMSRHAQANAMIASARYTLLLPTKDTRMTMKAFKKVLAKGRCALIALTLFTGMIANTTLVAGNNALTCPITKR